MSFLHKCSRHHLQTSCSPFASLNPLQLHQATCPSHTCRAPLTYDYSVRGAGFMPEGWTGFICAKSNFAWQGWRRQRVEHTLLVMTSEVIYQDLNDHSASEIFPRAASSTKAHCWMGDADVMMVYFRSTGTPEGGSCNVARMSAIFSGELLGRNVFLRSCLFCFCLFAFDVNVRKKKSNYKA